MRPSQALWLVLLFKETRAHTWRYIYIYNFFKKIIAFMLLFLTFILLISFMSLFHTFLLMFLAFNYCCLLLCYYFLHLYYNCSPLAVVPCLHVFFTSTLLFFAFALLLCNIGQVFIPSCCVFFCVVFCFCIATFWFCVVVFKIVLLLLAFAFFRLVKTNLHT